jgi:hypothetical protein
MDPNERMLVLQRPRCNAEYAANKAAIRASGQTKREFVAACRAGNEAIPEGVAAVPAPAPMAPALSAAPAQKELREK